MIFLLRRPFNPSFCYQNLSTSIRDYVFFGALKTAQQAFGRRIDGSFDSILIQITHTARYLCWLFYLIIYWTGID